MTRHDRKPGADAKPAPGGDETFVGRWLRRKREAHGAAPGREPPPEKAEGREATGDVVTAEMRHRQGTDAGQAHGPVPGEDPADGAGSARPVDEPAGPPAGRASAPPGPQRVEPVGDAGCADGDGHREPGPLGSARDDRESEEREKARESHE